MNSQSFNTVSVDLKALVHNYHQLREKAGNAAFLAMVKADAYGHGMVECSRALAEAGCTIFGVAELREAVLLRKNNLQGQILSMIGFAENEADLFFQYNITPVIYDVAALESLSRSALKFSREIGVHLKVDTGMSRLGAQLQELDSILQAIDRLPGIYLAGVASHFPCADDRLSPVTEDNYRSFLQFLEKIPHNHGLTKHIANSGGTLNFPHTSCDMVRCGISLYGYHPSNQPDEENIELQPVMSFTTRVLQVKAIPQGAGISYGHTYIADRPMKIAVLPIGYEDGFSRHLSNRGEVLIRGRRAPVRGRVCMNLCMVDITTIDGVVPGEEVVVMGKQGGDEITADEIGDKCGTISYEVLCMIGNNNERKFI